jgi:SAM-dependent methyltransferase
MQSFDDLFACPRCGRELARLSCAACGVTFGAPEGIPDLRLPSDERTERVREFYLRAPFPNYPPHDSYSGLRARAGRSEFVQLLDRSIDGDAAIAELGCGTGQLGLYLATAGRRVVGCDLSRASLQLAVAAAQRYRVEDSVRFIESDLRAPGLRERAFDVVIASGVLHHTPDPRASFGAVTRLLKPGGFVVIGLYNSFARLPLRLRRAVHRLTGKAPFDPVLRDRKAEPARREAWLRDQYEHPEEHRHTLGEVQRWFRENEVEYVRAYPSPLFAEPPPASLFAPVEDDWALEGWLCQLGWARTLGREGGLFVTVGRSRS